MRVLPRRRWIGRFAKLRSTDRMSLLSNGIAQIPSTIWRTVGGRIDSSRSKRRFLPVSQRPCRLASPGAGLHLTSAPYPVPELSIAGGHAVYALKQHIGYRLPRYRVGRFAAPDLVKRPSSDNRQRETSKLNPRTRSADSRGNRIASWNFGAVATGDKARRRVERDRNGGLVGGPSAAPVEVHATLSSPIRDCQPQMRRRFNR